MDKRKIIRFSLAIGIPLVILIILFNAPSIVTIESSEGATLSSAETKDGAFKKIGTTKVTRFYFNKPDALYVSAELNGKQTITSVKLKRFSNQSVRLNLADTESAKKVSDGAVIDANFNGDKGRGIVYGQDTLVNFSTTSPSTDLDPEFLSLPYIHKVVWYDFNNFVYQGDEGIGQFVNGVNKAGSEVGTIVTGDVNIDSENTTDEGSPIITDISKTGDNPLVLLSRGNIFTSTDMGTRLRAITSFELGDREANIFTSGTSIFKVTYPELEHVDDEDVEKPQITIEEFSYTGERLQTTLLDDDSMAVSVVKKGSSVFVLTQSSLHVIKDGEVQNQDLYFATPADMVVYNDQIIVLAKDGLWRINQDNSFQLIFKYSKYGRGLVNSMSVNPNNQLLFGTAATDKTSNTATFSLSF